MKDIICNFSYQTYKLNNIFFFQILILLFLSIFMIRNIISMIWKYTQSNFYVISKITLGNGKKIIVFNIKNMRVLFSITCNKIRFLCTLPSKKKTYSNNTDILFKIFQMFFTSKYITYIFELFWLIYKIFIGIIFFFYSSALYALDFSNFKDYILYHEGQTVPFSSKIFCFFIFLISVPLLILIIINFIKMIILSKLFRNAMDMPFIPKKKFLLILSLFLSCFVMSSTIHTIYQNIYLPFQKNKIQIHDFIFQSMQLIYNFMISHIDQSSLKIFEKFYKFPDSTNLKNIPFQILIPTFIISQLKTICHIGYIFLIPFLIIDTIICKILNFFGIMLNSSTISLPIKLILFFLMNGKKLIILSIQEMFY